MKRELTVRENLAFWRDFTRQPEPGRPSEPLTVLEAIAAVGLDGVDYLPFGYLSAGQQRRIAMARLLVSYRPLWILDEPTAALDGQSQAMFAGLVDSHLGSGGLVVAATHHALGLSNVRSLVFQPGAEAALSAGESFSAEATT